MDNQAPPFRYDARLANQIERRWQDRWEREGTFHSPDPSVAWRTASRAKSGGPSSTCSTFSLIPAGSGCTWVIRWATSARMCSAVTCA